MRITVSRYPKPGGLFNLQIRIPSEDNTPLDIIGIRYQLYCMAAKPNEDTDLETSEIKLEELARLATEHGDCLIVVLTQEPSLEKQTTPSLLKG
jgi:hypothetical protein